MRYVLRDNGTGFSLSRVFDVAAVAVALLPMPDPDPGPGTREDPSEKPIESFIIEIK